ncbi:PA2169 family four-helix-bundle protein [Aestuariibius insulae]|uniref:PA2169 family four-helix-bundle protein n=1 Tax=Aestuariibius insulae TaxID=2058287 RepID=UPI00345EDDE5
MTNDHKPIEKLYTRMIDSRDGYNDALDSVSDGFLRTIMTELRNERAEFAQTLRSVFASKDINLDEDGSLLASAHRMFVNLRDTLSEGDDAVLAEIRRGEQSLRDLYEDAMKAVDTDAEWSFLTHQRDRIDQGIARLDHKRAA